MEIIKTVKQYSIFIEDFKELQHVAKQYRNVKNYAYSRYSGINSLPLLSKHRQLIRDEWMKINFDKQWKLPARYWKLALDEAISNIKTGWSNTKRTIKDCIILNEDLTKEEVHYIRYILKIDKLYYKVLTCKNDFTIEKFKNIRVEYISNIIRRLTRRYKGNIPYSDNATNFTIDADMYSYELRDNKLNIQIMTTIRGKRTKVYLTDKNIYSGNLKILIRDNKIEIHKPLKIKSKTLTNEENILGIDKGYRYLLAVSNGKFYGEGLNVFLSKETERLKEVNAKRNFLYALEKKYREEKNISRADNILYNNLGKKKYVKHKQKHDQTVKSYINYSLNQLFLNDKPSEVVMENLDFVSWDDKYPKLVKRKLSRWIKGYIRQRLEYKCNFQGVKYTYINPAYTSKFCSQCGRLGVRDGNIFTCVKCGETHADTNASKNILKRKYDKEITLYTSYQKIKQILLKRVS